MPPARSDIILVDDLGTGSKWKNIAKRRFQYLAEGRRMMTDSELNALLDAHDALVTACVEERLTLVEFLAAYNDFPRAYGLEGRAAGADERLRLRRFQQRIAFHFRVLEVVSGPTGIDDEGAVQAGVGEFLRRATLMRLRQLVARYPDLKALPDSSSRAAIYSA